MADSTTTRGPRPKPGQAALRQQLRHRCGEHLAKALGTTWTAALEDELRREMAETLAPHRAREHVVAAEALRALLKAGQPSASWVDANRATLERHVRELEDLDVGLGRKDFDGRAGVVLAFDAPAGIETARGLGFLGLAREATIDDLTCLSVVLVNQATIWNGEKTAERAFAREKREMARVRHRYGLPKLDRILAHLAQLAKQARLLSPR